MQQEMTAKRLANWAEAHSKNFEVIAQKRDVDAPLANSALELVRKFIIERQLVLYGGQAIDFALRLKGGQIYPDHQTPDYDCFSPQNVDDAYELADRLVAAGFQHVGAIPAIHVQTMRVATNFLYVADISYAPPGVFAKLPTVSYAGMRVLHPDYQRSDIHLAFCFPFNNPPREDIFHRYQKDLTRFRLIQKFYPITAAAVDAADLACGPAMEVGVDLARVAIHGFAAYAAIRRAFDELAAIADKVPDDLARARELASGRPAPGISFSEATIRFAPPVRAPRLALATPWPDEIVAALAPASVTWFDPYMDSRPLLARLDAPNVDIYSTHNRLLGVWKAVFDGVRVTVATPQYVLLNFLYEAHVAPDAALRDFYLKFYVATLDLIEAGGILIAALRGGEEKSYQKLVVRGPFGLPVKTIGDANRNASYLIRLAQSARNLEEPPDADLPDLALIPVRYYPGKKRKAAVRPTFDYSVFRRAGAPAASCTNSPKQIGRNTILRAKLYVDHDGRIHSN